MHKQLSRGENQGACSQSRGLRSSLVAANPRRCKSNLWRALAPHVKPAWGAAWHQRLVTVFSEVRANFWRSEHPVFRRLNALFSEHFAVFRTLILPGWEELCSRGTGGTELGQLQA